MLVLRLSQAWTLQFGGAAAALGTLISSLPASLVAPAVLQQHLHNTPPLASPDHNSAGQQHLSQPLSSLLNFPGSHVPRRHASSAVSRLKLDDFITQQLMSCSSLGVLRRVMLRYKANMEAEHAATLLLVLQHLVLMQRSRQQQQQQQGVHHGRVTAMRPEAFSRTTMRVTDTDGPMKQLLAQMMGELGGMIWTMMADMDGPDLAKVLYSWAALDWHPEPQLLADVSALFLAMASAGGSNSSSSSSSSESSSTQAQQRQQTEQQQAAWMAAGWWGFLKLSPTLDALALIMQQQQWPTLLLLWTPQQLTDIATAAMAAADEQTAGDVEHRSQLVPLVIGLAARLAALLQQLQQAELLDRAGDQQGWQPDSGTTGSSSGVPLPWPAALLAVKGQLAVTSVNAPHLCWRMLQALAAVGVDVNEGPGSEVAVLLSRFMHPVS